MSEELREVLGAIGEMEERLTGKVNGCKDEIAANRLALSKAEGRLHGKIGVVDQKVEDHIDWEEKRYAAEEKKDEAQNKEIKEIKDCVGTLKIATAVNKTKIGLLSILGGSGTFGLLAAIKSFFSSTPPPQ